MISCFHFLFFSFDDIFDLFYILAVDFGEAAENSQHLALFSDLQQFIYNRYEFTFGLEVVDIEIGSPKPNKLYMMSPRGVLRYFNLGFFGGWGGGTRVWKTLGGGPSVAVRWFSRLPFSQSDPLSSTGLSNLGCFFGVEGVTRVWQTLGGGQSVAVRLSSRLPFSQSDFVFPITSKHLFLTNF